MLFVDQSQPVFLASESAPAMQWLRNSQLELEVGWGLAGLPRKLCCPLMPPEPLHALRFLQPRLARGSSIRQTIVL